VGSGNLLLEARGILVKEGIQLLREGELIVGQPKSLLQGLPLASPTMPLASPHSWAPLTAAAIAARKILQGKRTCTAPPSVPPLDLLLLKLTAGLHQASPLRNRQGIAELHNVPADGSEQVLATTTDRGDLGMDLVVCGTRVFQ
jgi:hypothetical protein